MCRSHTCWVFLDSGDFVTYWVPVSKLQHWIIRLSGVHHELVPLVMLYALFLFAGPQDIPYVYCLFYVIFVPLRWIYYRYKKWHYYLLVSLTFLCSRNASSIRNVLELSSVHQIKCVGSLFEGSTQIVAVKWNGLVAHVSMISEQYCYMALGQLIAVAWYMYRTIVTCLFFFPLKV